MSARGPKQSAAAEEEASLPRGGSGGKGGAPRRTSSSPDDDDSLFKTSSSKGGSKNKPGQQRSHKRSGSTGSAMDVDTDNKGNSSDDDSDDIMKNLPDITKAPARVDYLRFGTLSEGMVILGCVKEINEFDVVVSLPCNLKGFIKITEISDTYLKRLEKEIARQQSGNADESSGIAGLADFFYVGQYVRCIVVGLDDSKDGKRVELSMRESLMNRRSPLNTLRPGQIVNGSVASVEDHGYVISLGIKGANGFLLKKNAVARLPNSNGEESPLVEGQPVDLIVSSVNQSTKTVFVDATFEKIASALTKADDVATMDNLRPGMLVKVSVANTLIGGLWVRFLDYFVGTIDLLHLDQLVSENPASLKSAYKAGTKKTARILYIDFENKHIALTLQEHAVALRPFDGEERVPIGTIFDAAVIQRIDSGIGMVVELPSEPPMPAYVHISRVSDSEIEKLDKKFKVGEKVKCRVLGYSHADGLANATMRQSQIDEPLLRYEDIKVGDIVTGKIVAVHARGMEIKLTPTIKVFCPRIHLADAPVSDPESRFSTGTSVTCRVLSVDAKKKRVTVTHKKTLINDTLPRLTSYREAAPEMITYGTIIAVKDFGCILGFYNDVRGKAPLSELSTTYVANPAEMFHVGQVIKCRVLDCDAPKERLRVSFNLAKTATESEKEQTQKLIDEFANDNRIVSGEVSSVSNRGIEVKLTEKLTGFLPISQLSDHRVHGPLLKKQFKVGQKLDQVLLLKKGSSTDVKQLTLSTKPALMAAYKAGKVPQSLEQVKKGEVYTGFVKKIMPYGVFVSFVDGVTGLAAKNALLDQFVQNPEDFFYVGQTVLAYVTEIYPERKEFNVSLKPTMCSSNDGLFIRSFVEEMETTTKRKAGTDWSTYKIGAIVPVTVLKPADYGLILETDDGSKLTAVAITQQCQGAVSSEPGSKMKAVVLDVDFAKGILDVSLRPELVNAATAAATASGSKLLREGQVLSNACIELVKASYMILSSSKTEGGKGGVVFAYAATRDYNNEVFANPFDKFSVLQKLRCTISHVRKGAAVPYFVTVGASAASGKGKEELELRNDQINSVADLKVGMPLKVKIMAIKDAHMTVSIGLHVKGRIHITEVLDDVSREHPFTHFKVGQIIENARVIGLYERASGNYLPLTHQTSAKEVVVDVSVKPSTIQMPAGSIGQERYSWSNLKKGRVVNGWVHQVTADGLWVHISPTVRGRVFILDVSNDVNILRNLPEHYRPGQGVKLQVLRIDGEKQDLDLSVKALYKEKNTASTPQELKPGMVVPGRITRVLLNRGLYLQLFSHTYGRVFITDMDDSFEEDPLAPYASRIGDIVDCYVLGVNERQDGSIDLSTRPSRLGKATSGSNVTSEIKDFGDILPGTTVRGYIKNVNVSNKTCFISLNRNIVARVFFKNMSDKFVKDPVAAFPVGKLVEGRIISVDAKSQRVEMTLRKKDVVAKRTFDEIAIGEKVKGYIKRIEKFGIFVNIKNSNVTGLCHVSEVLDDKANLKEEDLKRMFSAGDYVKAVVLRKNDAKHQLSLSFKPSHFVDDMDDSESESDKEEDQEDDVESGEDQDNSGSEEAGEEDSDEELVVPGNARLLMPDDDDSSDDELPVDSDEMEVDQDGSVEDAEEEEQVEAPKSKKRKADEQESKDSSNKKRKLDEDLLPALPKPTLGKPANREAEAAKVAIDDQDDEDLQELASLDSAEESEGEDAGDSDEDILGENDEDAKEREVERREKQLLDTTSAETPQDFERLLLAEPNNSMIWIRFMAHYLFHNDVAKARETAEKALQRINIREQGEKRNVWIALMNLERNYGTKESLGAVFKRASAHNDPKDMHLELIKIYTRAKEYKAADEVYQTLIKRWKGSKAVWISYGTFKFQQGDADAARALLDKAIKSLPRRKHLAVISKFAQLEFKFGAPERGRTIFENILATYPKRVDIWSIYLDMEMKTQLRDKIRNLFERAVALNLSSKKMKFFFKRYLNFEKQFGTPENVEHVKQKAQEYVARKTGSM